MIPRKHAWALACLLLSASQWRDKNKKRIGVASSKNSWWVFNADWDSAIGGGIQKWLTAFISGTYQFSPLKQYDFADESIRVWCYCDRLMLALILQIIKPTFQHIISRWCLHLKGPSAVKDATQFIQRSLNTEKFKYVFRVDIKSYYASIDNKILLKQLGEHFNDPILQHYFNSIVTVLLDKGGALFSPTVGIPVRSSLSPFFGALYLSSLDKAFENRKGIFYIRYMDDIIILTETKRQYAKTKKKLFTILGKLKLKVSPHKTRIGALKKGFHFLGVDFTVNNPIGLAESQNPQVKNHEAKVGVRLHPRSANRALDKVKALREYSVNPENMQRYLSRWASWWAQATGNLRSGIISFWVSFARLCQYDLVWLGSGLLLGLFARPLEVK